MARLVLWHYALKIEFRKGEVVGQEKAISNWTFGGGGRMTLANYYTHARYYHIQSVRILGN